MAEISPPSTPVPPQGDGSYQLIHEADEESGGSLFGDGADDGSLFGDDGDDGSLFGDNASNDGSLFGDSGEIPGGGESLTGDSHGHVPSHFMEVDKNHGPMITLPTPESHLSFPDTSAENTRASSPDLLHMPTIPDPPNAQDGLTSGQHVVSTYHLTQEPFSIGKDEELDLESMMEAELLKEQAVNADTSSRDQEGDGVQSTAYTPPENGLRQDLDDLDALREFQLLRNQAVRATVGFESRKAGQDNIGIGLDQLTDFRWSGAATRRGIRLPCRIDLEEQHIEVLVPYVTFGHRMSKAEHFDRLGLSKAAGTALDKQIKAYLAKPQNFFLIDQGSETNRPEAKEAFLKTVLRILKFDDLGNKYFGKYQSSDHNRKFTWPDDSTLIIYHFASFLHKIIGLESKRLKNSKKAAAAKNTRVLATGTMETPIDLTGDDASASTVPTPAAAQEPHNVSPNALAEEVTHIKTRTLLFHGIPDNTAIHYRVSFKHGKDGRLLRPPATYGHQDDVIASGAVAYFQQSFADINYLVDISIKTRAGPVPINNQPEWDSAVRNIIMEEGVGCTVHVDVVVRDSET